MFASPWTTNALAGGSLVTMGSAMINQASADRVETDASRIVSREGVGGETVEEIGWGDNCDFVENQGITYVSCGALRILIFKNCLGLDKNRPKKAVKPRGNVGVGDQ